MAKKKAKKRKKKNKTAEKEIPSPPEPEINNEIEIKSKSKPKVVKKVEAAPVSQKAHAKVLSVDDEEVIRSLIKKVMTKAGYDVKSAASGEEGLKIMNKESFDLAIIDLKMPGMGGMAFLEKMKELYPDTEAVILTGFGDIDTAVDAMKKGAFNFVPKPFSKDTFLTIIERALERRLMKKEMDETRTAMRDIENDAAKKIGKLEGQIAAVEDAKKELGEQFNSIKKSLVDGTGNQGELEKKVMSLEKVASRIKDVEGKLIVAEKAKKDALKKAKQLEKELSSKVSGNVGLGNKLDDAKDSLQNLKKEVKKKKDAPDEDGEDVGVSLGDIHSSLADFRKEIEDL